MGWGHPDAHFGQPVWLVWPAWVLLVEREVHEVLALRPDERDDVHGRCLCDAVDPELLAHGAFRTVFLELMNSRTSAAARRTFHDITTFLHGI